MPMIDLFEIGQSRSSEDREFDLVIGEDGLGRIGAIKSFLNDDVLVENLNWNNTDLLVYHSMILKNNKNECAFVELTFEDNKDDKLIDKRKALYSKFFKFETELDSHVSVCLNEKNLFPANWLFFVYVLVMDEKELGQEDHKFVKLENDRIVLEEAVNQLKAILELSGTNLEQDRKKLETVQSELEKTLVNYKIEQKIAIQRVINSYQSQLETLGKEDIL